jgi:hypothetical protein
MPSLMGDARALDAIARIERALARIEASARTSSAHSTDPADEGELAALRDVHQALRSRVEGAIHQIDRLLESEES